LVSLNPFIFFEGGQTRYSSDSHRITECSGLAGTSVGHLVQPSCQSRVTYSRLHRTLSRQIYSVLFTIWCF